MNTFPVFTGLGWDIKKKILFSTAIETASSGAVYATARWTLPHYEFRLSWKYLSQANRDALEAFVIGQAGPAFPFLLAVTNDNTQTARALIGTVNGVNKIFQLPLPAQAQYVAGTLFDNGGAAGAASISAAGLVTFTTAPVSAHVLTWTGTYAYLVRFAEDDVEINQMMSQMYEQAGITFRTAR